MKEMQISAKHIRSLIFACFFQRHDIKHEKSFFRHVRFLKNFIKTYILLVSSSQ
jgi:hypothetical protein